MSECDVLKVGVIRGDGIGPEVVEAALEVLDAVGHGPSSPGGRFNYRERRMGLAEYRERGDALPDETLEALRGDDAIFLGAVMSSPEPDPKYRSGLIRLRKAFDLYANVRPAVSFPVPSAVFSDVDLVIVRENTECLYSGEERDMEGGEGAEAVRRITRAASERIVRYAFALADRTGRTKVTAVHKSNVLPVTDGVFLRAARKVEDEYREKGIALETVLVDAMAADLVRRPGRYGVLVTTNMFGDILSDLASQLAGGLGLAPSANVGDGKALFEPVHGAAPDIAGKGIANPTGCILSAAMMLEHFREGETAGRVRSAVGEVLAGGAVLTPDLGGTAGTREFTKAVVEALLQGRETM